MVMKEIKISCIFIFIPFTLPLLFDKFNLGKLYVQNLTCSVEFWQPIYSRLMFAIGYGPRILRV